MGNDMVAALPRATAASTTLFGHNSNRPGGEPPALRRVPGRAFAPGEQVRAQHVALPQARRTATVLAGRPAGRWGYANGVNEHGVAAGVTTLRTRLRGEAPGLTGTDLVRLALERAATAVQAVDVVTDLVGRHGPGAGDPADPDGGDPVLLLADGREAYALVACGRHWAVQQVRDVRALGDVGPLRQDWDRISPGLAGLAIESGWWPADGSKLDFAAALAAGDEGAAGLRRWGRATLLLEQGRGRLDAASVRALLGDHGGGPASHALCQHGGGGAPETAASLVADLGGPDRPPLAWAAFGPPCGGVYLPVTPDGELPVDFDEDEPGGGCALGRRLRRLAGRAPDPAARPALDALQARLDRDAAEYLGEARALRARGAADELRHLAGSFMQHAVERFGEAEAELLRAGRAPYARPHRVPGRPVSEATAYPF
jgi:secernin